jgi:hypothetical protein
VTNQDHENCSQYWNFTVPIPNNLLVPGTNLIAVQARDRGLVTGFDFSLTGPASLVPAKPLTLVMSVNPNIAQGSITIAPTATLSFVSGQPATFTAFVGDTTGKPAPNIPVTFNISGSNAQQSVVTTGANGLATFTYTGNFPGTDIVQASAQIANAPVVSTQTQVVWSYLAQLPPSNGTLTLSPSSPQTQTMGPNTVQTFTVTALDGSGHGVPNVSVTLLISIANTQQLIQTTNSSGVATFSYGCNNVCNNIMSGTDTVEANAVINGTAAFSNLTTVKWNPPQQQQITYIFTPQGWIGKHGLAIAIIRKRCTQLHCFKGLLLGHHSGANDDLASHMCIAVRPRSQHGR